MKSKLQMKFAIINAFCTDITEFSSITSVQFLSKIIVIELIIRQPRGVFSN